jgi:hypothetical protein
MPSRGAGEAGEFRPRGDFFAGPDFSGFIAFADRREVILPGFLRII